MKRTLCAMGVVALGLSAALLRSSSPIGLAGGLVVEDEPPRRVLAPVHGTTPVMQRAEVLRGQRLRILDRVSGRPLAGVEVRAGHATAKSDSRGRVTLAMNDASLESADVEFETGGELPELTFSRRVVGDPGTELEVHLPVYAGVAVSFGAAGVEAARGMLLLRPRCEVAALPNLDDGTIRALQLAERLPGMLEGQLTDLGLPLPLGKVVVPFEVQRGRLSETLVYSAHAGSADITVHGTMSASDCELTERTAALRNVSQRVHLVRGESTAVVLDLAAKPWVRGRLVDENGRPLAGVRVTVAGRSEFDARRVIPHEPTEPGSPAIALVRRRGDPGVTGLVRLTRRTSQSGEFAIPLSFTDRIAAWACPEGRELAYCELSATERFADVVDVVLVARPKGHARRPISLIDPTGEPIGGVRVRLLRVSGDNPFQCHPPEQVSTAGGEIDLSRCIAGERYVLQFPDGGLRTTELPVGSRSVVVEHL